MVARVHMQPTARCDARVRSVGVGDEFIIVAAVASSLFQSSAEPRRDYGPFHMDEGYIMVDYCSKLFRPISPFPTPLVHGGLN